MMLKPSLKIVVSLVLLSIFWSLSVETKLCCNSYKSRSSSGRQRKLPGVKPAKATREECECGTTVNTDSDLIIDGNTVEDVSKFPFMVTLNAPFGDSVRLYCGGAIISPTFILTAAHCVENLQTIDSYCKKRMVSYCYRSPENIYIGILSRNSRQPCIYVKVKKVIPHPNYNTESVVNDIALIKLKKPLQCTRYTRPICLNKEMVGLGKHITIAGYGARHSFAMEPSPVMKQGTMTTVRNKHCKDPESLEAIGRHQIICLGDSGGSAFIRKRGRYFAVGVTSMVTDDECRLGEFGCFTKISLYYSFIREYVHDLPGY